MLRTCFLVFAVVLRETAGIRPNRLGSSLNAEQKPLQKNRFKNADIEREVQGEILRTGGVDFVGVTSKDANPYVETYRALLTDVAKLLTDHKIVWHITFGTLIGFKRMEKFLPYDSDLDIYLVDKP